jgi:Rnl2 family RNA ligase
MDVLDDSSKNWTHVSYEKILENFDKLKLTESDYRAFKKTDWVVTEKIHGANFSMSTDGSEVRFAKRKEFLPPGEDFFDYQSLKDKLENQTKEIFQILRTERTALQKVTIYGELFGGEYPHPDVPTVAYLQAVQTGVYYSPKIEYCAFDITIEEKSKSLERIYLDFDKALAIFQQVAMMYAKPLFIGKYEEALLYNNEFDSTISAALGLPKLPNGNKAEGVVIKPVKSIYVETSKGKFRPIIKRKIPEFAEDSRYHQATKWTNTKTQIFTEELSLEAELCQEMLALVTVNRLNNVISKFGRVAVDNENEKQQIVQLLVSDVLETFNEEYESIFTALALENQQSLIQSLRSSSRKLVDSSFK